MGFVHTNLFNKTPPDININIVNIPPLCIPFCNIKKIATTGLCPQTCISFCNSTCKASVQEITPPPDMAADTDNISHITHKLSIFLKVSIIILVLLLFLIACYLIYKFYFSKRLSPPQLPDEEEPGPPQTSEVSPVVEHHVWYIRTIGLQKAEINAISIVRYKKGDGLIESSDCSVCLSEFEENEALRLLPKCSHAFHVPCIDTWLSSHTNCPVCRAGVVKNASLTSPSSQEGEIVSGRNSISSDRGENGSCSSDDLQGRIGIKIDEDHIEERSSLSETVASVTISNDCTRPNYRNFEMYA